MSRSNQPLRKHLYKHGLVVLLILPLLLSSPFLANEAQPKWIRVSSSHFTVLTDADEARGREVAVRFEQLRSAFGQLLSRSKLHLAQPLEIIAVRSREQYSAVAPFRDGRLVEAPGVLVPSADRDFVLLDLSESQSWRAVSYDLAKVMIKYNYPPAQPWFDEGFAEYFASIVLDNRQVQAGSDPSVGYLLSGQTGHSKQAASFTQLLRTREWIPIEQLFASKPPADKEQSVDEALFRAESWIVMHYLVTKDKLSETGHYFQSVEVDKMPVQQALTKAYGLTPVELTNAVREYFSSLPTAPTGNDSAVPLVKSNSSFASPVDVGNIGTGTVQTSLPEAQASLAELAVRTPEHRELAMQQMETLIDQPKLENTTAHRALGWGYLEKKQYDKATEEFARAIELDPKDAMARYQLSLLKFRRSQDTGKGFEGLANMMQDLRVVTDWKPDLAEAYNLLALARLDGGGSHSALEAIQLAIQFNPRDQRFLYNLAQIYVAGKRWEDAEALLARLKASDDATVARDSQKTLADLPTLKKFGLLPQSAKPIAAGDSQPDSDAANAEEKPAEPPPIDKRPVKFLKGKLLDVDCSSAPAAILHVVTATGRSLRMRTEDFKALQLIGSDSFSCDWHDQAVAVNYKAGGKADGDLVSLEIQ